MQKPGSKLSINSKDKKVTTFDTTNQDEQRSKPNNRDRGEILEPDSDSGKKRKKGGLTSEMSHAISVASDAHETGKIFAIGKKAGAANAKQ